MRAMRSDSSERDTSTTDCVASMKASGERHEGTAMRRMNSRRCTNCASKPGGLGPLRGAGTGAPPAAARPLRTTAAEARSALDCARSDASCEAATAVTPPVASVSSASSRRLSPYERSTLASTAPGEAASGVAVAMMAARAAARRGFGARKAQSAAACGARGSHARGVRALAAWPRTRRVAEGARRDMRQAARARAARADRFTL
jgi:hypothetical protein